MENLITRLADLSLEALAHEWTRRELHTATDAQLIAAVVTLLTPPKRAAATSFQLHAPLELMARVALLPHVAGHAREGARQKIAELGVRYAQRGEAVPRVERPFATNEHAAAALSEALLSGDSEGADAALVFLLEHEPTSVLLARLRPLLVDHLGAAAHAPILVAELPRVVDRIPDVAQLLRAPVRSLTQNVTFVRWHRDDDGRATTPPPTPTTTKTKTRAAEMLTARLLAPPKTSTPSHSIAPTMRAVEDSGLARELFADVWRDVDAVTAERVLSRVAAQSMLQDTIEHAPYGWTHCLTLPQAVLRMAQHTPEAQASVAVAATFVLGFRSTLGAVRLDPDRPLPPAVAPEANWIESLATRAALHTDAHFAKYVVACLDAARRDPEARMLYLHAAERLAEFWARRQSAA